LPYPAFEPKTRVWRYCPSCSSPAIHFNGRNRFSCADCGFVYYQNVATAAAAIIKTNGGILFLVRGKEPGKGLLGFPGGFANAGEDALTCLCRECGEELGWEPERKACTYFDSFPNIYPYKEIIYNTCDLYFTVDAPDLSEKDLCSGLRCDGGAHEVAGFLFLKPEEIFPEKLAFQSARAALSAYILRRAQKNPFLW
jgi:ADP-ribose pyrophosphatase YjhB (NUDIX family)